MRFKIHGTKEWLNAIKLKDIDSSNGEVWRYSVSNYTDGRQSISIIHGDRSFGTISKEIFFDNYVDVMECICVCHGNSLELYSEGHLWEIGVISSDKKVQTIVLCHTDGTVTGLQLDSPVYIDVEDLKSINQKQ